MRHDTAPYLQSKNGVTAQSCFPRRMVVNCMFFFFQAEDGIRDLTVTGVQTCALPIFEGTFLDGVNLRLLEEQRDVRGCFTEVYCDTWRLPIAPAQWSVVRSVAGTLQIGRASCRERG